MNTKVLIYAILFILTLLFIILFTQLLYCNIQKDESKRYVCKLSNTMFILDELLLILIGIGVAILISYIIHLHITNQIQFTPIPIYIFISIYVLFILYNLISSVVCSFYKKSEKTNYCVKVDPVITLTSIIFTFIAFIVFVLYILIHIRKKNKL